MRNNTVQTDKRAKRQPIKSRTTDDIMTRARQNVARSYITRPTWSSSPPPNFGGQVPFRPTRPIYPSAPPYQQQPPGVPPWAYMRPPTVSPVGPPGVPYGGGPPMMMNEYVPSTAMRSGAGGAMPPPSQYGPIQTQLPPIPPGGFPQGGPPMMMPSGVMPGGMMQGGAFQPPRIPQGGFGAGGGSMPMPAQGMQGGAFQPPSIPPGGFQYRPGQTLGRLPSTPTPAGTPPVTGYDPNRGGWGSGFGG